MVTEPGGARARTPGQQAGNSSPLRDAPVPLVRCDFRGPSRPTRTLPDTRGGPRGTETASGREDEASKLRSSRWLGWDKSPGSSEPLGLSSCGFRAVRSKLFLNCGPSASRGGPTPPLWKLAWHRDNPGCFSQLPGWKKPDSIRGRKRHLSGDVCLRPCPLGHGRQHRTQGQASPPS